MSDQERFDDCELLAWGKFKRESGEPEESFTDEQRQFFIAGIAWFVADETRG